MAKQYLPGELVVNIKSVFIKYEKFRQTIEIWNLKSSKYLLKKNI